MTPVIDMSPPAGLNDFLESHGWAGAQVSPVAGDASFRRYFRIDCAAHGKAILMDGPLRKCLLLLVTRPSVAISALPVRRAVKRF